MHLSKYIEDGCTIENALIKSADISTEDWPTVCLELQFGDGCGVVYNSRIFGRRADVGGGEYVTIGWDMGMTAIFRIMQLADVTSWSDLPGRPIRAIMKNNIIQGIAHFLEDRTLDYAELAKVCPGESLVFTNKD